LKLILNVFETKENFQIVGECQTEPSILWASHL